MFWMVNEWKSKFLGVKLKWQVNSDTAKQHVGPTNWVPQYYFAISYFNFSIYTIIQGKINIKCIGSSDTVC